ncbi:MAG: metal-dependent hydrolase [Gammaproteobacteria bacterium]|nr:metal-dependent hydrolase [Gammaproteobacteria bacterium]
MNAKTQLAVAHSQSKLPIEPRRVRFDYQDIEKNAFHQDNMVTSAYWVGLSSTFPIGEAEFIKSVRLFENQIVDEKLRAEVQDFAAQEAHHSLQHKKINKQFDDRGYNTKKVESLMEIKLKERAANWTPEKRLMRTVSAEHFTAVMAHHALTHPQVLDAVPESLRNLMLWHAIEEVEHKSVAFDVYKQCVGDMGKLRRHYMHFAFIEFPMNMIVITRFLLKDMGHKTTWKERKGMWRLLFGKDGMISSVKGLYLMFLKKNFHPWQHDDSALVAQWKEKLAPHFSHH